MRSLLILQRMALSLWVGGAALFTFLLTPTLFRSLDRDHAGMIVGLLFPDYFRWGLCCGVIALVSLLASRARKTLAGAVIICAMLAITSLQAFVIEPRAATIKAQIPSFTTTPVDDPLRQEFKRLHAISASGNLGVIGGGLLLLALL
ncbi:MAG: DUF4149 domain-containing protein [Thermodesulfobacteriota bacterium]